MIDQEKTEIFYKAHFILTKFLDKFERQHTKMIENKYCFIVNYF